MHTNKQKKAVIQPLKPIISKLAGGRMELPALNKQTNRYLSANTGFGATTTGGGFGQKPAGGFGAAPATTGGGLFGGGGGGATTGGFGAATGGFGAGATTGTNLGLSKPQPGASSLQNQIGFGATPAATGTGVFGGATAGTGFGAGAAAGGFGATASNDLTIPPQGTAQPPFAPFIEKDAASSMNNHFQTITFQAPYTKFSLEVSRYNFKIRGVSQLV